MQCHVPLQDFYDLTWAYLERAAADRVAHVELFFDPQSHTERGVPFLTALAGIRDALAAARAKLGISSHVIMCFLRHLGPDAAMATLLEVLAHRQDMFCHCTTSAGAAAELLLRVEPNEGWLLTTLHCVIELSCNIRMVAAQLVLQAGLDGAGAMAP